MEAKMHFARLARSAAFLLLMVGFALPAQAQNNKPIRSGNFFEDRAGTQGGDFVVLKFAQTPTDKFANITNVACQATTSSTQSLSNVVLLVGTHSVADDLSRHYYMLGGNVTEVTDGSSKLYSFMTNGILYKMGPGRFPSINLATTPSSAFASMAASCVIVGNLTDN